MAPNDAILLSYVLLHITETSPHINGSLFPGQFRFFLVNHRPHLRSESALCLPSTWGRYWLNIMVSLAGLWRELPQN